MMKIFVKKQLKSLQDYQMDSYNQGLKGPPGKSNQKFSFIGDIGLEVMVETRNNNKIYLT